MNKMKKLVALLLAALLITGSTFSVVFAEEEDFDTEIELGEGEELLGDDAFTDSADSDNAAEKAPSHVNTTEVEKTISEMIEAPKLSGVDFVEYYEDSFEFISEKLRLMGIFNHLNTDPEQVLTRGDYAMLLARILNNGNVTSQEPMRFEFKDVEEEEAYAASINMLCNHAIVQGDGNGYFKPEAEIKSGEAIIMLLNLLGYHEIAQVRGDGDAGYRELALEMKFIKDAPFSYDTTVTLATAAKLIYRALHEKVAVDEFYKSGNVAFRQSDETLMYHYMNILTLEGVVSANEYTSIYSPDEYTSQNCIKISNTVLEFKNGELGPENYLGLKSRVYYRNDTGKNIAIFIEALDKGKGILKINAKDIENYDPGSKRVYYTVDNKMKDEKIEIDLKIIFNNSLATDILAANSFTPDAGQLVFIDNNHDGRYDILMIDSYSTYVVKNTLTSLSPILYDQLGMQNALDLDDKTVTVYKNNVKSSYENIVAGDVVFAATEKATYVPADGEEGLTVYQKLDTLNSKKVKLLASNYSLSGKIESISEGKLYIDGIIYEYSKNFLASDEKGDNNKTVVSSTINVNITGAYDLNGDIVWLDYASEDGVKYAFIVKVAEGRTSFDNNCIKFFSQDGKMISADFGDKVKIFCKWPTDPETDALDRTTYYSKTINGKEIISAVPSLTRIETVDGEQVRKTNRQIIKYKLDSQEKVSQIYLAATDTRNYLTDIPMLDDGIFYHSITLGEKINDTKASYYFSLKPGGTFSPHFIYRKTSSCGFKVPADESIEEEKYFTAYSPLSDSSLPFTSGFSVKDVELYDVDIGTIGAFVYRDPSITISNDNTGKFVNVTSSKNKNLVIDTVKQVLDEQTGEYLTHITAWSENKVKDYVFANSKLESNIAYTNKDKTTIDEMLSLVDASELKRGDMIVASFDVDGRIDGFSVAHRPRKLFDSLARGVLPDGYERSWASSGYFGNNGETYVYIKGFLRGLVINTEGNAPFVNTSRTDEFIRHMIPYSSANQLLIYDYKNDLLYLPQSNAKAPDYSALQEGDYMFWQQNHISIPSAVAVRNYE